MINFLKNCLLLPLTLVLFQKDAYSCINEYKALLNGEVIFDEKGGHGPIARFNVENKSFLDEKYKEVADTYQRNGTLENYSDLGAMHIYKGEYPKAKQIFLEIENQQPGLYQTASNLGTTYELLGNNDSALFWIQRAVQLNPNSHEGSEWIHIKILQAKIKAAGNQNILWTTNILSLNFGDQEIPENVNKINLLELRKHIYYQLRERMSFIKPKDPIVAQLLFDLGNLDAMTINVKSAIEILHEAKQYGYSSDLFDERLEYFEKLQYKADLKYNSIEWAKKNPYHAITIAIITLIICIGLFVLIFRKIKKRRNKN